MEYSFSGTQPVLMMLCQVPAGIIIAYSESRGMVYSKQFLDVPNFAIPVPSSTLKN